MKNINPKTTDNITFVFFDNVIYMNVIHKNI
jgi:hypothetical protein